jgi:HD-GYP domain-containing protein (c-di-GMP phosphodiesterase class II)
VALSSREETALSDSLPRRRRGLAGRELTTEAAFALAFVVAGALLAWQADAVRTIDPLLAAVLTCAFALLSGLSFHTGVGLALPTQVLFIPMLLLLPTDVVPLLVAAGLVAGRVPDVVRGRYQASRLIVRVGDAWYSLAPAAVIIAFGAQTPSWADVDVYALAVLAQAGTDALISAARAWLSVGAPPGQVLREVLWAAQIDVALAPLGFLTAAGAEPRPAGAVLVLPLAVLLRGFAADRRGRIEHALELSRTYRGTALLLGDVVEDDDAYTGEHTRGVVALALRVADRLGLGEEDRRLVEFGALLHDVGKIAVPKAILHKPGPLNGDEWEIMRQHTIAGQRLLDRVGGVLADVGAVVRASHERWDGTGYPDGIAGAEIPLPARVVSACDAYNAMTTDRPYRRALPVAVAVSELRSCAGTQLDPQVVDALIAVLAEAPSRAA